GEMCRSLGVPAPTGVNLPLIQEFKRGVMDLIFSQTIRFKSEDSKNVYEDWSVIELSQIADRVTKKNASNDVKLVLTNSATQGIVNQGDYFDKKIANANNLGGYYVVNVDDFVYNPRLSKSAPVGPIKRNKLKMGVMSPLYTVFRFKGVNRDFMEQYFESTVWHDYMRSIANYGARHDRMNISLNEFFEMPILLPGKPEQTAIASFLSALDELITLIRN
ncbi:MAG: restriction endonuclease subunit S, partial [Acidobacteria bacterium]|nr:restriction endonuclease subunit S [Acidobacteriota bacterium]